MSEELEVRGLIATFSTLKWFVVIGFILALVGGILIQLDIIMVGVILLWVGIAISTLSLISLFFFWLTDRFLKPKDGY